MFTSNKFLMLLCACMLGYITVQAQVPTKPKPATNAKTTAKPSNKPANVTVKPDSVKVPTFTVRFGPYNGTMPAPAEDIKKVIGGELTITDQQGQKWNPIAWRFIWNKKEINDDWKTGKRKTIMTYNLVELDSTNRLPESWQVEIREFIQSGEEFLIERIIMEHPASKRKMVGKDLAIKVI